VTGQQSGDVELPDAAWRRRARRKLLQWFDQHARQLPWRPSPGLYETWISEIMLQQTQVATVAKHYERFLQRFPNVHALADASQQEVLRQWEGLGYYRRARQLHEAAQVIVHDHGGQFPTSIDPVRALPGIGRYTAGAILSIALDQRYPILEANTRRLLSRLITLTIDPFSRQGEQHLWAMAERLLPRRRAGDLNQALMELGSTICVPREPACPTCPLSALCPTKAAELQDRIPLPRQKTKYTALREAAVVVWAANKFLLRRCQRGERWEGLWDFPRFPVTHMRGQKLDAELVRGVAHLTGLVIDPQGTLATIRHGVTRYRITLTCHWATCEGQPRLRRDKGNVKWVDHEEAGEFPLSVTGRKIWQLLAS